MKYVRAKDGIWDRYGLQGDEPNILHCFDGTQKIRFKISKAETIKKADTIEELCDCFVDYCKEDDSHLTSNDKPVRRRNHEIYGAIWTDKGLIYVAKMNDKGELELL